MAKKKSKPAFGLAKEIGKKRAFTSLQQETFLNLFRTQALLLGEFRQQLFKPNGLSHEKYNAMRILAGEKRPMQIYEIAERMISPQTDISRLIERLVSDKLVSRERCESDRRVVWIQLTANGKELLRKLAKPVEQLHLAQFENLSDRELATLNRLLVKARSKGG